MHRTFQNPRGLLGGLVALLLGGLILTPVRGQTCSPESRPLQVLLNSTTRLQMSSRKPIKTVVNPKEGIISIRTIERDPTTVLLVGAGPGVTKIELEDADGTREVREVVVQADTEYLTQQLKRAVPVSSIQVIPNGTNSVVLTGYVGRAEDIQVANAVATSVGFNVINGLRLNGVQQVQLDVVIAQVRRTRGRDFGFNFFGNARQTILGSLPGSLITPQNAVGVPSGTLSPTQFGQAINAFPTGATGTLFGGIISNSGGFLFFLQALEQEGVAKVLAQPRLVTLSGNPASFLEGGEQAIPVPAGLGQVGVQFEEFGTRLNFLPIVLGNGRIHLEVEPEVSRLDAAAGVVIAGATVPGRATQRIHTTVEMETGQTFVIGGLIQKITNAQANKVPVIGQVPFLGALFSEKVYDEEEVELVVMVTPHLVDAQSVCQVSKVLPGQESRSADDFELFLEGILEAPRGPRRVFQGNRYVPAYMNGAGADLYPCAGRGDGCHQMPITPAGGGGVIPTASQAGPACSHGTCPNGGNGGLGHLPTSPAINGPATSAPPVIQGAPPVTPPPAEGLKPSGAALPEGGDSPVTPAVEKAPASTAPAPMQPLPGGPEIPAPQDGQP
jgi:pilus assembly protein CpaC